MAVCRHHRRRGWGGLGRRKRGPETHRCARARNAKVIGGIAHALSKPGTEVSNGTDDFLLDCRLRAVQSSKNKIAMRMRLHSVWKK
eukprot:289554-Prorocentrum_minimum.AAC.1